MSDLSDDVFVNKSHDVHCRKRTRTTITRQHKAKLELIFQANRYQSRLDLADIARNIGLSQHVIKIWFQNRRAKFRKQNNQSIKHQQLAKPCSSMSSCSSDSHLPPCESVKLPEVSKVRNIAIHYKTSCCPPQRLQGTVWPACKCTECKEYDKWVLQTCVKSLQQRRFEVVNTPSKPVDSSACRRSPLCCCLKCREGMIYVQY